jgi:hypothetical protein
MIQQKNQNWDCCFNHYLNYSLVPSACHRGKRGCWVCSCFLVQAGPAGGHSPIRLKLVPDSTCTTPACMGNERGISLMLLCWYVPAWYTLYDSLKGDSFHGLQQVATYKLGGVLLHFSISDVYCSWCNCHHVLYRCVYHMFIKDDQ